MKIVKVMIGIDKFTGFGHDTSFFAEPSGLNDSRRKGRRVLPLRRRRLTCHGSLTYGHERASASKIRA